MSEVTRKLSAILIADVQGYARLMERDEEATRRTLNVHRARMRELTVAAGGRVIDTSGDSVLVEFASVQRAVECAMDFQRAVARGNRALHPASRMEFRIGVNVGDVLDDGASIYGDAINIAARIEKLAPRGGVCVSGTVRELVEGRAHCQFHFLREQRVRNRSRQVRVFRLLARDEAGQGTVSGAVPVHLPMGDEPAIAVLPFQCRGEADGQVLGDGLAEDLITALSRFRTIHVMARATSFSYRDGQDRYRRLNEELGVQYALEGSIRTVGERMRITAQLVECETGKQLWGDHYTHDAEAIFDVQDEVVSQIVSMLENRLLKDRLRASSRGGPQTRGAYDDWLRGHQLVEQGIRLDEAEDWFHKAIAQDPGFARAYTSLAAIGYHQALRVAGGNDVELKIEQALDHGRTALRLDPVDGRAHAGVGWGCLLRRDFAGARRYYDMAGDLHPNDADILVMRARAESLLGNARRGVELAGRAMRLNPVQPRHYLDDMGEIKFFAGRYDDCVHSMVIHDGSGAENLAVLAAAHGLLGECGAARRVARRFLDLVTAQWVDHVAPTDAQCLAWLDRLLPLRDPADRRRLFQGLAAAGIASAGLICDGDGADYAAGNDTEPRHV